MTKFIISLRFKQFYRAISEVGLIRMILVLPFVAIIILGVMERLLKQGMWSAFALFIFILVSTHFNRKDKHFLKKTANQRFTIYVVEYILISLPIIAWFIYENAWQQIIATFGIILILPFINWTFIYQNAKAWLRFPMFMTKDFEWIVGIRKNIGYIIPLYILGLILSYMTASVLVVLLLLAIITTTFYLEEGETRNFLYLYANSPKNLMRLKVIRAIGLFLLFTIPLSIAFLIFHYQYWYLLLAVLAISSVIQLTSVTLKYTTYQPKASNQRNAFLLGFLLTCWLTPFLQPVPLLMTITYYRKAINRLKNYY
ncbi:MAG: hypothetical protein AB8G11_25310 [Saprospiraceae bacterium]